MRKSEYPKEAKTLGQKIRKKRMDLGLSLLEVAQKAEITEGYLSRIEAEKQSPKPVLAGKIAEALNESVIEYTTLAIANQFVKTLKKTSPSFSIEDLYKAKQFSQILKRKKAS